MPLVLDREIPGTRGGDIESHVFYMDSMRESGGSLMFDVSPHVDIAQSHEQVPYGAIGLRELTLTAEQAQVVTAIVENRTAQSIRPPRHFPPGDESLLR